MAPKMSAAESPEPVNMLLDVAKRILPGVTTSRILRWADYPGLAGSHVIPRVLIRGKQGLRVPEGDVMTEGEMGVRWP